uniref:Uncharacterized protein n=1 Tax=uncultured prokaryote TaxID=198431 RepID=A0A0H5Q4Q8_9ZZZZ|nr:hypothetical protein [uncultured prokaryote]
MPVIQIQLTKHRSKTDAKGGENAFFEWLERMGLEKEGFYSVVRTQQTYKGKPMTFYVASYGSFQTIDGWEIYLTYRADIVNHVRYHTWKWDGKRAVIAAHSMKEFINI